MDINTEVNLDTLFSVIEAQIQAKYPTLLTVEFDRDEATAPPAAPACLLELSEWDQADSDPETGQLAIICRFEARLLIAFNVQNAKAQARKLAMDFAAWMRRRTWRAQGHPSGPAQVVGGYRDDFSPVLDKYEVWRVEWTQEIHIGASVWTGAGVPVTQVFARLEPVPGIGSGILEIDLNAPADGVSHPIDEYTKLTQ